MTPIELFAGPDGGIPVGAGGGPREGLLDRGVAGGRPHRGGVHLPLQRPPLHPRRPRVHPGAVPQGRSRGQAVIGIVVMMIRCLSLL